MARSPSGWDDRRSAAWWTAGSPRSSTWHRWTEGRAMVVVGIAGGSGSGKTTVVRAISEGVAPSTVAILHHDAYYRSFDHLDAEERAAVNFDHPDALETSLMVEHVDRLSAGEAVEMPVYDFHAHTRTERTVRVEPARILIVDGILILSEPELRDRM